MYPKEIWAFLILSCAQQNNWDKNLFNKLLSFILGNQIQEKEKGTFQDCQFCRKKVCSFKNCHDLLNSSIFCQTQVTANIITSQESFSTSTLMLIHSTSEEPFASTSTTGNYDTNQSPSSNDTQQMSSNFILSHKLKN